jgi:colicin import membrane protein
MGIKFISPSHSRSEWNNGSKSTAVMFAASAVGHIVFLLILILTPNPIPAKRYTPSVINVSMVSAPVQGTGPRPSPRTAVTAKKEVPKPKTSVAKKSETKPAAVRLPEPEPARPKPVPPVATAEPRDKPTMASETISVAPRKKKVNTKISLKKKTFRSSQVIKRAIKRIEKKTEKSRPQTVTDAIDKLKDTVETPEKTVDTISPVDQAIAQFKDQLASGTGSPSGRGGGGRPGLLSKKVLEQIDLYKLEIAYHIEKKWAFSEHLTGDRTDLEAVLVIKIMPNGEIRDIWFEKKSGNSYFDDSVYKAIKKSNPLPPLPKGYQRPFYNLGLVFTPSGLRRGMG